MRQRADPADKNCAFVQTSIEFRSILQAQHDDAAAWASTTGPTLFSRLLNGIDDSQAS